ncbi:MAG: deoxyribodipyrimidine photo-lyase, partial [Bacteroidota bacterium]
MGKILPPAGLIGPETTVFWFRRDLRVKDNRGLFHALQDHGNVLPVFIFDPAILDALEDRDDRRVQFIHESLELLKEALEEAGGSLQVLHGDPIEIFDRISPKAVCCNHDIEPYAVDRDRRVAENLAKRGIPFHSWKDQVIFEKDEVVKDDGKPYTVYTPFSRKWLATLREEDLTALPSEKKLGNLHQLSPLPMPTLEDIGFSVSNIPVPERKVSLGVVRSYDKTRDIPSILGTSRLGVHLRFGTVSIRHLVSIARKENKTWLNELIWREFYQMILWHFPHVVKGAFKPAYDRVEWRKDP